MRWYSVAILIVGLLLATTAAAQFVDLDGTAWQLVSIDGEPVLEDTAVTFAFGPDNTIGGSGGCNSYGGSYELVQGGIGFRDIVSTLMACTDAGVMEQESAYFAALQAVTSFTVIDGQLVLTYGEGRTLVFDPRPTLPDSMWRLTSIDGQPLISESEITLAFDAESGVTGGSGCNQYNTTYTLSGSAIAFEPVIRTEMACLDETLMQQEDAYLAALQAAVAYAVSAQGLTITTADGQALVFERVVMLASTAWQLESLGRNAVAGTITLQFDQANGVTGSGGCNQYNTTYTLAGDAIAFGTIISTKRACASDVMRLEADYFAALEAAARYVIDGERLTIITLDGSMLTFAPAVMTSG